MSHDRIYLQADTDTVISNGGATWCRDRINADDVEYVRADLLTAAKAEVRELAISAGNQIAALVAENRGLRGVLERANVDLHERHGLNDYFTDALAAGGDK